MNPVQECLIREVETGDAPESAHLRALTITYRGRSWLAQIRQARLLHVFGPACNLINDRGEVLSLVTAEVGAGPFSLVVAGAGLDFQELLSVAAPVTVWKAGLALGQVLVDARRAQCWAPRPHWGWLHARLEFILPRVTQIAAWVRARAPSGTLAGCLPGLPGPGSSQLATGRSHLQDRILVAMLAPARCLVRGVVLGDIDLCRDGAHGLAGLGTGLTPAGDDFLLGAGYAAWIIHPQPRARSVLHAILETASPRTTPLSAAWLGAASRGEAGAAWHSLLSALAAPGDEFELLSAVDRLLAAGHTSGAQALAGFIAVLHHYTRIPGSPDEFFFRETAGQHPF